MEDNFKNKIINGDCFIELKKIPDRTFDLVFADPPYNLQLKNKLTRPDNSEVNAVNDKWDQFESFKKYDEFIKQTDDVKNFGDIKEDIKSRKAKKAILRYSGVAFEYLNYQTLPEDAKEYLNENLIIFSNLFGILKPTDLIPFYTLKQGAKPGFDIYKFYAPHIQKVLDEYDDEYVEEVD